MAELVPFLSEEAVVSSWLRVDREFLRERLDEMFDPDAQPWRRVDEADEPALTAGTGDSVCLSACIRLLLSLFGICFFCLCLCLGLFLFLFLLCLSLSAFVCLSLSFYVSILVCLCMPITVQTRPNA